MNCITPLPDDVLPSSSKISRTNTFGEINGLSVRWAYVNEYTLVSPVRDHAREVSNLPKSFLFIVPYYCNYPFCVKRANEKCIAKH
jgi:hypothetical protein